jgi:hypothetical protein
MTGVVAAGAGELEAKLAWFVRENRLPGGAAVDHEDVHGDGHHAAARCGPAGLGRSCRGLPS